MSLYNDYLQVKKKNSDALVFYRVGDFYELFGPDAITASEVLDLTLTSRDCGLPERVPMCGVPCHSVDSYIAKIIQTGHKAAVCEPVNEPPKAESKPVQEMQGRLNLTAVGTEQTIIKDYLEQNASEALADKINNGVRIVKDGKTLINKKTLDTFMQYACEEAHKLAEKGARSACIGQDTVFGWAVHYFEENDIIGTFYNEDGTEYKPPKPVVNKTAPKPVSPPKPKPQQSLFDLIDMQAAPKAEAETVTDEEPEPDKLDEESCGIEPDEQCETENTDAENSDAEDEQDDEPDIPKGLHQISETEWADEDGVIYETTEVTKPAVPEAFIKLFGGAVVAR